MPQRILFVNTPTYIGGAEISLLTLIKHLQIERFKPLLLTSGNGPLLQRVDEFGIPVSVQEFPWFSRRRPWQYAFSIYQLVKTIRQNRIDLIHTNCDHSLRYVMRASKLSRVPYVSHVRDFTRTWFQPDQVEALSQASRVIANSHATARACAQAGIESSRIVTIYNPIDVAQFLTAPASLKGPVRAELGLPVEALVIGIVGQIQSIKGHLEFVEAGFQLAARLPEAHFLVVGVAPPDETGKAFERKLQARVHASEYANRFHFAGFRSDIPAVMKAIDILAVPSWAEPFGRVAVEGLAAGCAVVGTNSGGLPEIITDNVDGLLVPPKDSEALAAALHRLAIDPSMRQRIVRTGQHTAQKFSILNHIEKVQDLYEAVLSGQPVSAALSLSSTG